ncbi:MAG: glycosyltransferase [Ktedonobacterales bacterium]
MRIVFVTAYPPSRMHPRAYGFVTSLARRHDLTAICLCHTPADIRDVALLRAGGVQVMPVFEEASVAAARSAGALLGERSLQVAYDDAPRLREAVRAEIARGGAGLVHVEHVRAASAALDLPVPVIWDTAECTSLLCRLQHESGTQRRVRATSSLEAPRVRGYERQLLQSFPYILTSTERDRIALIGAERFPAATDTTRDAARDTERDTTRARPPEGNETLTLAALAPRTHPTMPRVLPTGVDLEYFTAQPRRRHANRLVFSGNLRAPANIAAAEHLLREILPRVWAERPDVRVTLAGANPPRHLTAYASDPRVTVTGTVDDLRPYVAGATVAVSPMTYSAGIQNGILEAMALGTPVVATEAAVSGLAAIPGRDFLVAGATERFAQLLLRLLDDDELWRSLSRSGRAYVERQHAWPRLVRQLETIYQEATGFNFCLASAGVPVVSPRAATM